MHPQPGPPPARLTSAVVLWGQADVPDMHISWDFEQAADAACMDGLARMGEGKMGWDLEAAGDWSAATHVAASRRRHAASPPTCNPPCRWGARSTDRSSTLSMSGSRPRRARPCLRGAGSAACGRVRAGVETPHSALARHMRCALSSGSRAQQARHTEKNEAREAALSSPSAGTALARGAPEYTRALS